MLFCPLCESLLLMTKEPLRHHLKCRFCIYTMPLEVPYVKSVDFGEPGPAEEAPAADPRPQTDCTCPKCSHPRAYYSEMQTRSADEPATVFYQCASCGHTWKEG